MLDTIVLGGGCFWCVESVFLSVVGVKEVESGYAGGHTKNPDYRSVCSEKTGHAEVVKVTFDTDKISLREILEIFFVTHDPTTLNRQGNDVGTQYRSTIMCHSQAQKDIAQEVISTLDNNGTFNRQIVTEVTDLKEYYRAEEYHQNYFNKNPNQPYCVFSIPPKLKKLKKYFPDKVSA
ncbi:MAG: peptide-methionine (S)-S-oxide reductase MsrA [Microcoleaceae cyanobacterium MO_207.B10]|nr:peptide-methionine (S)-S-oxide reductase MsrA [Microcoleaceae cyanobacterium MO_207.B10]